MPFTFNSLHLYNPGLAAVPPGIVTTLAEAPGIDLSVAAIDLAGFDRLEAHFGADLSALPAAAAVSGALSVEAALRGHF